MVTFTASQIDTENTFEALYEIVRDIGRRAYQPVGAGSYVAACVERATKYNFAVKFIQKDQSHTNSVDYGILLKIQHPNLVRMKECLQSDICLYLILEFIEGGLLFEYLIRLNAYTEKVIAGYFKQMVEAILYLHENGIIHKNIKPENVMLSSREPDAIIKISDTSLYRFLPGDTDAELVCCNPTYCAPELLKSRKVDKAFDLWTLGVMLHIMLRGTDPFHPKTEGDLYRAILNAEVDFADDTWSEVSRTGRDVVKHLLVVDPPMRLNTARLLTHSWTNGAHASDAPLLLAQKQLGQFMQRRKAENKLISEQKSSKPSVPLSTSSQCGGKPILIRTDD